MLQGMLPPRGLMPPPPAHIFHQQQQLQQQQQQAAAAAAAAAAVPTYQFQPAMHNEGAGIYAGDAQGDHRIRFSSDVKPGVICYCSNSLESLESK